MNVILKPFLLNEVFPDNSSPLSFFLLRTTHTAALSHILLWDFSNTVILYCNFIPALSVKFRVCIDLPP